MKTFISTLGIILFLCVSCEKDKSETAGLQGKWIVKKMLADPGDGSGRYQDVSGNTYIDFRKDGDIKSNAAFGLNMLKSYQVTDSVTILFSFKEISSQPKTKYRYKFSGDTLVLNPPCIEGCGIKLVRAN